MTANRPDEPAMETAGYVLAGLGSVAAMSAAVRVLMLRPQDFVIQFDGAPQPRFLAAQVYASASAFVAGSLGLAGTLLIAFGR
jgi:hypothetical protein